MDRSKSKFENDLAERLYALTPDEEIGSVQDAGWWGYFRQDGGGVVLHEDTQGFVWVYADVAEGDWQEHVEDVLAQYGEYPE